MIENSNITKSSLKSQTRRIRSKLSNFRQIAMRSKASEHVELGENVTIGEY